MRTLTVLFVTMVCGLLALGGCATASMATNEQPDGTQVVYNYGKYNDPLGVEALMGSRSRYRPITRLDEDGNKKVVDWELASESPVAVRMQRGGFVGLLDRSVEGSFNWLSSRDFGKNRQPNTVIRREDNSTSSLSVNASGGTQEQETSAASRSRSDPHQWQGQGQESVSEGSSSRSGASADGGEVGDVTNRQDQEARNRQDQGQDQEARNRQDQGQDQRSRNRSEGSRASSDSSAETGDTTSNAGADADSDSDSYSDSDSRSDSASNSDADSRSDSDANADSRSDSDADAGATIH